MAVKLDCVFFPTLEKNCYANVTARERSKPLVTSALETVLCWLGARL